MESVFLQGDILIIYRLENYKGNGPFHASQGMAKELVSHYDPTEPKMLESVGLDLPEFEYVTDRGMLFGWGSKEDMRKFFRNPGRAIKTASRMKFKISVYESSTYFKFMDGQILFLKESPYLYKMSLKELFMQE